MALVGSFPFNSFLSEVLSCIGTKVLAGKCQMSINNLQTIKSCLFMHALLDMSVQSIRLLSELYTCIKR